jgi:tetratricopeptide (TPR) repeat protein/predicted Ser/Thr protein kinase
MTLVGSMIGTIRIASVLGAGGMGTVYLGFDEKLEREVAVKAIRGDSVTPAARARFLREARALSQLDHPNICSIHGFLETPDGDYLVLERIRGRPLPQAALDLQHAARLEIAEQVARALVAAHAKGIVHRDLKLENIFVTTDGTAKVLDFGIAQLGRTAAGTAASDPLTPPDLQETAVFHTQLGLVVGTARSMSPEQARGEPVTVASDMYSYGLLLQELLTDRPVYDPALATAVLLERVVRGETLPVTGLAPDLTALLERLKSIAPEARPTAPQALARLRAIRGKPRHRLQLAAAVLVALGLVATATKVHLDLRHERDAAVRARGEAEQSRREAEQVAGFLVDLFRVSDPGEARGSSVTAREILDRGAERIASGLRDQPLTRARLLDTIGQTYFRLGLHERARPLLEQGLKLREATRGAAGQSAGERADVARSLQHLGTVYQAEHRDAEPLFQRALAIEEQALGYRHPDVALTLNSLGTFYAYHGEMAKAEPLLQRALAIREAALGPGHPDVAATLNNLGGIESSLGHAALAESLLKRGLAIREAALPPDHPDLAANLEGLAVIYDDQGRWAEGDPLHRRALAIWEKTLGPEHPRIGLILTNLAKSSAALGRPAESEALSKRAIALREKVLGPDHPDLASSLHHLANLYRDEKRYAEAEPLYRRAMSIETKALRPNDPALLATRADYRSLLRVMGPVWRR